MLPKYIKDVCLMEKKKFHTGKLNHSNETKLFLKYYLNFGSYNYSQKWCSQNKGIFKYIVRTQKSLKVGKRTL